MHPPKIQETETGRPTEDHRADGANGSGDATTGRRPAGDEARPACAETRHPLPPGQHRDDPVKKDIDPVGFALERVQTFLVWIDEHRASFERARDSDEEVAESELSNLRDATRQGMIYLQRLSELLLAGYTFDPSKRLPDSLRRGWFSSYVDRKLGAASGEGTRTGGERPAHQEDRDPRLS